MPSLFLPKVLTLRSFEKAVRARHVRSIHPYASQPKELAMHIVSILFQVGSKSVGGFVHSTPHVLSECIPLLNVWFCTVEDLGPWVDTHIESFAQYLRMLQKEVTKEMEAKLTKLGINAMDIPVHIYRLTFGFYGSLNAHVLNELTT